MSAIEWTVGEDRNRIWRFRDQGGAVDFSGADAELRITAGVACVAVPASIGPDAGDLTIRFAPQTISLPPRSHAYGWQLWVTWTDGSRQILDRGTLNIRKACA